MMNVPAINTFDENIEQYFSECEVTSKYHVIAFEFYLYTSSFVFPRKDMEGYKLLKQYRKYPKPEESYKPHWDISRFLNLETKNRVLYQISSRIFKKNERCFMVKIAFYSDKTPLTSKEVYRFINPVTSRYKQFITGMSKSAVPNPKILELPKPYLSKVEMMVNFKGTSVLLIEDHVRNNLYKKRGRKRDTIGGDEENVKVKDTFDGRTVSSAFPTRYISKCYKDYSYSKKGKDFFKIEPTLRRSYLQKNGIQTLEDLEKFDKAQYWADEYFFFQFDKERILSYVQKKKPSLVKVISILLDADNFYSVSEIYDKLREYEVDGKKLFQNPSRQLLKTKWHKADAIIQEALSKLTLSGVTVEAPFQPIKRKRDKTPGKRGRMSKEPVIVKAIETMTQKGMKITYKAIRELTGISDRTIAKYKHLLKGN